MISAKSRPPSTKARHALHTIDIDIDTGDSCCSTSKSSLDHYIQPASHTITGRSWASRRHCAYFNFTGTSLL